MGSLDVAAERNAVITQLKTLGDPRRAASEKAYLKSSLNFHGVNVPTTHKLAKDIARRHRTTSIAEVAALAEALWHSDWHEERSIAIFLLQEMSKKLTLAQMPLIERMIHEVNTWAHLDEIAVHVVGALLAREPSLRDDLLRWAADANFWVRRTAILAQNAHFRRGEGDLALFEQITAPMLDEGTGWSADERFFIRKAIGWALRELAPDRPEWVAGYVQRHRTRMSGLTLREATRKLPPEWQAKLDT